MGEWKEYKLGEIIGYLNRGITPIYTENEGLPILNQKCIRNGKIDFTFSKLVVREKKYSVEKQLRYFDILINSTGVGTAGRVAMFDKKELCYVDSHVSILRLKENVSPKYVFYNLLGREREIEGYAEGSTGQIELARDKIKDIDILLPQLSKQKIIVAILSSLDDKIDLLNRQNATLEKMAETLFRQWFSNIDNESTIGQLITLQNGYAFKSKDFKECGIHGVIKIKNISGGTIDIENTEYIDDYIVQLTPDKFKVKRGDILIAMTGAEIGKLGIIPETDKILWLNQRVGLLLEKYKGAKFLAYLQLKSEYGQDYIENTATGSAQPNISGMDIEKCGFPKVEVNQLKEYSQYIGELYDKIVFNLGQIRILTRLRDTLLPKLMNGEITVR